jgi:hypothetical protein
MGSWTNPNTQQITTLISVGSVTGAPAGTIISGTAFNTMNLVNVSQFASYDLNCYITALSPGNNLSVITGQIQLQWFDDVSSGIPVFEEDWYIWAGRAAPVAGVNTLSACGPMHGKFMSVNVFIPPGAGANATLQYMNIYGSGRILPYSDWRQNGAAVNPQIFNLVVQGGGGLSFENILASVSGSTLAANTVGFIPLGLYSGPVWLRYGASAAPALDPCLSCAAAVLGGQIAPGANTPGVLVHIPGATLEFEQQFILPRGPTIFVIKAPAAAITWSLFVAAQQAA